MSDEIMNSENTAEIAITQQTHEPRKWTDDEINTIKNTVAKDATDEELNFQDNFSLYQRVLIFCPLQARPPARITRRLT